MLWLIEVNLFQFHSQQSEFSIELISLKMEKIVINSEFRLNDLIIIFELNFVASPRMHRLLCSRTKIGL